MYIISSLAMTYSDIKIHIIITVIISNISNFRPQFQIIADTRVLFYILFFSCCNSRLIFLRLEKQNEKVSHRENMKTLTVLRKFISIYFHFSILLTR